MATCAKLEELPVWPEAGRLYKEIIGIMKRPALNKEFRFCSQIKTAAGSVMDNIAEGFEPDSNPEFINHLRYAKGSAGEARSPLYSALDESFVSEDEQLGLNNRYSVLASDTATLIRYGNHCEVRGLKFAGRNEKSTTAGSGFTKTPRPSHDDQKSEITNQKSQ